MGEGHYSKRARETGYQIESHFFEAKVLDRYKDDPYFEVTKTRVSTKDGAPEHVESSMIQQYVWGTTTTREPCVVVILAHLCTLSAKDQEYWRLHELSSEESAGARIEARYSKPILYGEFPDTVSGYEAVFLYLREIQKLFTPDTLFSNFDHRHPDFLAPIPHDSKKAMANFAQDLHSLTSMSMKTLVSRIRSPERREKMKELLKQQQSRNLMRLYFEEHGVMSPEIESGLEAMGELNRWRVDSAHKLVPAEADQDYRTIQKELVDRLQRGLRAMLEAFVKTEGAVADSYRDFVLQLDVN